MHTGKPHFQDIALLLVKCVEGLLEFARRALLLVVIVDTLLLAAEAEARQELHSPLVQRKGVTKVTDAIVLGREREIARDESD